MLNYKCPKCSGEMSVNRSGDLLCSYCDSKFNFTDKELKDYKEFRYNMLRYLSSIANHTAVSDDAEKIWHRSDSESFVNTDGTDIEISYIYKSVTDGITCFTARNNVIFLFPAEKRPLAERYKNGVKLLSYPSADVRDLAQYFPVITGGFELKDGAYLLSVSKPEEVFPLGAFGSLPPVHAAWIVSRLENLCCVMEYSGLTHGGISLDGLFINARTHELYLLGGWENVTKGCTTLDLAMMRDTVKRLMGSESSKAPQEFSEFLDKKHLPDAYTDFADWDKVIETGFGGRRFEKLDLTDIMI
jgi:DNA-directed RNA polymerase subunit RPC12/RpoP